ncbi:hypothetical protein HK096_008949, partial [Nowakowskiella sp. JEL0078]
NSEMSPVEQTQRPNELFGLLTPKSTRHFLSLSLNSPLRTTHTSNHLTTLQIDTTQIGLSKAFENSQTEFKSETNNWWSTSASHDNWEPSDTCLNLVQDTNEVMSKTQSNTPLIPRMLLRFTSLFTPSNTKLDSIDHLDFDGQTDPLDDIENSNPGLSDCRIGAKKSTEARIPLAVIQDVPLTAVVKDFKVPASPLRFTKQVRGGHGQASSRRLSLPLLGRKVVGKSPIKDVGLNPFVNSVKGIEQKSPLFSKKAKIDN